MSDIPPLLYGPDDKPLRLSRKDTSIPASNHQEIGETVDVDSDSTDEQRDAETETRIVPNSTPAIANNYYSKQSTEHTPNWKKIIESFGLVLALGILIVNIAQNCANWKAMRATENAAYVACQTLLETRKSQVDAHLAALAAYAQARAATEPEKAELTFSYDAPKVQIAAKPKEFVMTMKNVGKSDATNITIKGRAVAVPNGVCPSFAYPKKSTFGMKIGEIRAGETYPDVVTSEFPAPKFTITLSDDFGHPINADSDTLNEIYTQAKWQIVFYTTTTYSDFLGDYTITEADQWTFVKRGEYASPKSGANYECIAAFNKHSEKPKILPPPEIVDRSTKGANTAIEEGLSCPVPNKTSENDWTHFLPRIFR